MRCAPRMLDAIDPASAPAGDAEARAAELLERWQDGRVKLWLMSRILAFRAQHARWFETGSYVPVTVRGAKASHVCAFARVHGERWLLTVATRLFVGLVRSEEEWPIGADTWTDTRLVLPANAPVRWQDLLVGARREATTR